MAGPVTTRWFQDDMATENEKQLKNEAEAAFTCLAIGKRLSARSLGAIHPLCRRLIGRSMGT